MKKIIFTLIAVIALASCGSKSEKTDVAEPEVARKIVSLNGTITEIIFDLQESDQLVGIDVTSSYPEKETAAIANLGHLSGITAESILGLAPTHVLGFKDEVPAELIAQLEAAKIEVVLFEREYSISGVKSTIAEISKWFNKTTEGEKLANQIDEDLKGMIELKSQPHVLFVYARGVGMLMVAGENTQMDKMISLAGGKNAVSGFEDFKPLTPESVIAAKPDLLLLFNSGTESLSGGEGLLQIPGVKMTPAGINKSFLSMDGLYVSGFGPRIGKALVEINQKLNELK